MSLRVAAVVAVMTAACWGCSSAGSGATRTTITPVTPIAPAASQSVAATPTVTATAPTTPAPAPRVEPTVVATVALADGPKPIVTTGQRIWVATAAEIVGVDPQTNTIVDHIERSGTVAMAVDPYPPGSEPLWLYACSAQDTVRIDTGRAEVVETFPYGCTGLTWGPNALQVVNENLVVEIGPSGDVVATIPVAHGGSGVGSSDDSVWVADGSHGAGTITRLESGMHTVLAEIPTPATTKNFLGTHADVWVTTTPNRATGDATSLIRIDLATNAIAQTYAEGVDARGLDLSGRFLWVAAIESVFVIDTATNRIVDRPALLEGRAGGDVVASNGSVWLTVDSPGAVLRVDPGSFGEAVFPAEPPAGTRVEVTQGCPTTIGTSRSLQANPFVNTDITGLADEFVPGTPVGGLICRYAGVNWTHSGLGSIGIIGGSLTTETRVTSEGAAAIARAANDVEAPPYTVSGCFPGPDGPGYTVIAFAYAARVDVDLWYRDSCPSLSNGVKTAEPLVNGFGAEFAAAISP